MNTFVGPIVCKTCPVCSLNKAIEDFQRQPSGRFRRHSYCRSCANQAQRSTRVRNYSPAQKRRWTLKTRYGVDQAAIDDLAQKQGGLCALCPSPLDRFHIDHCHNTGAVRGLLCHRCNIRLGGWDDLEWRARALRYLGVGESR